MMGREGLRGFASGLLIATIVLGSFYYIEEKKQDKPLTLAQLKAESKQLGYNLVRKEANSIQNHSSKDTNPTSDGQTNISENEKKTDTSSPKSNTYKLIISPDMTSQDIGQELKKHEVINDASDFNQFLVENNFSTKLQIGEYVLTNDMSYTQIASIITK